MAHVLRPYRRITSAFLPLHSVVLLAVHLYWRFQFVQTGWGKLHNLAKIMAFFASLNIPFPSFTAPLVSTLEFLGGLLLMLGLLSRPIALLLACNMVVAYWTADREALSAIFSDPGKFYAGGSLYIPVRVSHGSDLWGRVLCSRYSHRQAIGGS
jgi:putative oxidoreductase